MAPHGVGSNPRRVGPGSLVRARILSERDIVKSSPHTAGCGRPAATPYAKQVGEYMQLGRCVPSLPVMPLRKVSLSKTLLKKSRTAARRRDVNKFTMTMSCMLTYGKG
eukprot:scaffold7335_cov417-Prasinococcus_capsulatus_cf.AAC.10